VTQKQIQYFDAVCKTGSVTKAAEDLFVSRPVISRAIHELEEEIGAVLFIRTNNGLILTEHGSALHTLFAEFNRSFDMTIKRLHNLSRHRSSRLIRVGITPTNGKRFFPGLYTDFHEAYHDIRLQVVEIPALESPGAVIDGFVDVAFSPAELDTASFLGSIKLYESQFVFCVSRSGPLAGLKSVTYEEIASFPIATLYSPVPPEFEYLSNFVLKTSQQDLVRMSVAYGAAYAVLPIEMVEDWDGVAAIPFEPCTKYSVKLIWNKSVPHNSAVSDLLSFMENYDVRKLEKRQTVRRP
jgi:DNA-binding transcriptional LysR family regulator